MRVKNYLLDVKMLWSRWVSTSLPTKVSLHGAKNRSGYQFLIANALYSIPQSIWQTPDRLTLISILQQLRASAAKRNPTSAAAQLGIAISSAATAILSEECSNFKTFNDIFSNAFSLFGRKKRSPQFNEAEIRFAKLDKNGDGVIRWATELKLG